VPVDPLAVRVAVCPQLADCTAAVGDAGGLTHWALP
jgi:hypothetical protein